MLNGAWYCGLDVRAKVRFTEARGSSDVGGSRVLFRKEQSRSGQASSVDPSVRVTDEIGELAGRREGRAGTGTGRAGGGRGGGGG